MADKHPYVSGSAPITNSIQQFKKSFPPKVNAETLKKLGIAPNNESYVINVLRFIGALDAESNRTPAAHDAFSKHDQAEFQQAFGDMVKAGYGDLFALHGDAAWSLDANKLISFFRGSDKTSDVVGRRQATTFQVLASFAGHGDIPSAKASPTVKTAAEKTSQIAKKAAGVKPAPDGHASPSPLSPVVSNSGSRDVGLTVRIEVNLPAGADQETYDRIFRSIRENLLNAK